MRILKLVSTMAATSVIVLAGWSVSTVRSEEGKAAAADPVARGEYLVIAGGCHDCHSPKTFTEHGPEPDMTRALSGSPADMPLPAMPTGVIGPDKWGAVCSHDLTAWVGPWGVSFASNLTPDKKTGLGEWTEQQFIDAMRKGKHRGFGRAILPPMPWFNLAQMAEEDLKAIFAYLQSLPAMNNKVRDPLPPAGN